MGMTQCLTDDKWILVQVMALVSSGNNPLRQAILNKLYDAICRHYEIKYVLRAIFSIHVSKRYGSHKHVNVNENDDTGW